MANTSEAPTEHVAASTPTNQGQAGAGQQRRIVKAATPKANGDDGITFPSANGLKDEEDEKKSKKHQDLDVEEEVEQWRQDRLKATEKRGKALREKELQARRQANAVNETANSSANPFSRFLSAFSIESTTPKRSYEEDDKEEEPKKRLKPSESSGGPDYGDEVGDDNSPASLFSSKILWITAALSVAVAVGVAINRGRKN